MQYKKTFMIGSLTAAILVAMPFVGLAKDNGKGNSDNGRKDAPVTVKAETHSWLSGLENGIGKAWGHLIAPGWLKNFGEKSGSGSSTNGLPPGIAKHLDNDNDNDEGNGSDDHGGTTTPTTTPLVLSGLTATAGQTRAQISWNTNHAATSDIWYGTTTPVNVSGAPALSRSVLSFNHTLSLNNLSASTTYHFVVRSVDSKGQTATSSESSFTTKPAPLVNPLSISNAVALVGSTSVKLTWNTSVAADSEVYFSTSSPVTIGASSTTAIIDGTLGTSHTLTASGLSTSTAYYFLIRSVDASSNTASTGQFSLVTGM